jgi:hypothetical protein
LKPFLFEHPALSAQTYNELNEKLKRYLETIDPNSLSELELQRLGFLKLNMQRIGRINKTYSPGEKVVDEVSKIDSPQLWMILTEGWCGDSAQNLPYIAAIAGLNSNIVLRILERDKYPEIMDKYLTDGISRSIPKLIAFDIEGAELFQWGPRPKEAKELVRHLKSEGYNKKEFTEKLHLWYGRNRGNNIEAEFLELLKSVNTGKDCLAAELK